MHTRVGPAGWSYDDWGGIVYPRGRVAERLGVVARRSAEAWVERLREVSDFLFTAKLVRAFTHGDPRPLSLSSHEGLGID